MRPFLSAALAASASIAVSTTAATAAVREEPAVPAPAVSLLGKATIIGRSSVSSCERWRSLAGRLGETHAGHKLRHLLSTRLCSLTEDKSAEHVWAWPWRFNDVRADLPAQHHGRYGAWEIRCDEAGARRRCALSLETVIAAVEDPEQHAVRVVSHVVIDTVAGRESVLWRVHVAGSSAGAKIGAGIAVDLAGRSITETFDACGPRGCMAEAEPAVGAEVASALWQGRPITIRLMGAGDREPETGMLASHGFRAGLKELIRLRRHEARALAGR